MKTLRPREGETAGAEDLLEEVSTALAAGRLVELLRGHGLTKQTVEELLRPESAVTLQAILTQHLAPLPGEQDADSEHGSGPLPPAGGKVLAFKARKSLTR